MPKAKEEIQTFTLGEKTYDIASIPEEYQSVFNDVNVIEGEIQRLKTQTSINIIARDTMINKFKECLSVLVEVPTEGAEATAEEPAA